MSPDGEFAFASDSSTPARETAGFPQPELTLLAVRARGALPAQRPTLRPTPHTGAAAISVPPNVNGAAQHAFTRRSRE
jgi:hypothetical protein